MKEIDHPALIQEWKLNPDTEKYLNKIDKKEIFLSKKKKLIITIAKNFGQKLLLKT